MSAAFDAVLVVAFGGPGRPEDVRPFLQNVLRGRRVSPERIEEVAHHYERFGGVSPLTPEVRDGVVRFLAEMPSFEGGMRANARAPLADLLSTFTATWTLDQLGALDRVDTAAALSFARSVEIESGGFR